MGKGQGLDWSAGLRHGVVVKAMRKPINKIMPGSGEVGHGLWQSLA
jgi:hypothetical protein